MPQTLGGVVAQLAEEIGEFRARGGVGGDDALLLFEGGEAVFDRREHLEKIGRQRRSVDAGGGEAQRGESVAEVVFESGHFALTPGRAALRVSEDLLAGGDEAVFEVDDPCVVRAEHLRGDLRAVGGEADVEIRLGHLHLARGADA